MRIEGQIHRKYVLDVVDSIRDLDSSIEDQIDCLTHDARRDIRDECERQNITLMPRNLFYDYAKQCVID